MADNPVKWAAPVVSLTDYLTTSLNSLANNTLDLGAAIDNTSNLARYMDLELTLASLDLSSQTSPCVVVYMLESVDGGTDYDTVSDAESADDNCPPADKIIAIIGLRPYSGAEAKLAVKSLIPIPPGHFKLAVRNKTGVAFGASGNKLAYRTYNEKVVTS
jgi:hypothetical protein